MFGIQPVHRVSAKGALYSHDLESVLIMRYEGGQWSGLPGGHVEIDEDPDTALIREVKEELNLDLPLESIERMDFFKNDLKDNRIILGYTAVVPESAVIEATHPKREYGEWFSATDIAAIPNLSDQYKRFVLENWPSSQQA